MPSNLNCIHSIRLAVGNALFRAIGGSLLSAWVPPVLFFILSAATAAMDALGESNWPFWGMAFRSVVAGIAFSGLAFIVGLLGLMAIGVPFLFVTTLLRINHPLIVAGLTTSYAYWRHTVTPIVHQQDGLFIWVVVIPTAIVASLYSRSAPSLEQVGLSPAKVGTVGNNPKEAS